MEKVGKKENKEEGKALSIEEILNSNNVELVAKYAKENRNKLAIEKVRELLELARKTGEEVVQNFLNSFKECEKEKIDYINFENTESGKLALGLLEKIPEPFKASANKKLEDYKKELKYNTELFKKYKNNPEKIWKDVFRFDYYNIPDFKERFKNFLFKDIKAISEGYYKDNALEAKLDPFAINFFIENPEKFEKAYGGNAKNTAGFSDKHVKTHANVIRINESKNKEVINNTTFHESEHAIHQKVNILKDIKISRPDLTLGTFDDDKKIINNEMRPFFINSLKNVKDEIFAFQKGGTAKGQVDQFLSFKIKDPLFKETSKGILNEIREPNYFYDYNEEVREANYKWIESSQYLLEIEKQKLKDAINFLQSEYDRVLKNMIDIVYEKNHSVEFFRNVPINELWKYSNGKYKRTDFIIREFKF